MNDILLYLIVAFFITNAALNRLFGTVWMQQLGAYLKEWWLHRGNEPEKVDPEGTKG